MYKNLNPDTIGVSGRQSELIELALTYGFRGLEINIQDMLKRARSSGVDQSARYLKSANIQVGGFSLPVEWQKDEPAFRSTLGQINESIEIAKAVGATCCTTVALPGTDDAYNVAFEQARSRITEIAELLAPHGISLAVGFVATAAARAPFANPFIHQAEALMTLIKTVSASNVGLLLDTWHWKIGGGNADQLSEFTGNQVVSVILGNAPDTIDPVTAKVEDRILPQLEGWVDNTAILKQLLAIGYDGPVAASAAGTNISGKTRDAIVQQSTRILDDLFAASGVTKPPATEGEDETVEAEATT